MATEAEARVTQAVDAKLDAGTRWLAEISTNGKSSTPRWPIPCSTNMTPGKRA